jgi:hypothetical protein
MTYHSMISVGVEQTLAGPWIGDRHLEICCGDGTPISQLMVGPAFITRLQRQPAFTLLITCSIMNTPGKQISKDIC